MLVNKIDGEHQGRVSFAQFARAFKVRPIYCIPVMQYCMDCRCFRRWMMTHQVHLVSRLRTPIAPTFTKSPRLRLGSSSIFTDILRAPRHLLHLALVRCSKSLQQSYVRANTVRCLNYCTGKPRHLQDSRVMNASLKAEDAIPAKNDAEARMHMQVLDKMLAKRKSVRDIFVKMDRDTDGCVSASSLREQ